MATSLASGDCSIAFPRFISRVYHIQAIASAEHAPHRSHLGMQLIPASAPHAEERSHSRGPVLDF